MEKLKDSNKTNYKISVIIPTYNVEEYIKECLDSVLAQTFKDFEIIVVDNGSEDATFQIVENYSKAYNNISLYKYDEGGVGGARNFGISKSSSEFLMFVDGDDLLAMDALENLYKRVIENKDLDIVVGNLVKYRRDGIDHFPEFKIIHKRELIINSIKEFHLIIKSQTPTNKLFRRSLLDKHGISFPENIVHEDLYFTTIALLRANRICIIPEIVYYYRKFDQESITSNDNEAYYFEDRLKILNMIDKYLLQNNLLHLKKFVDRYKLEKFLVPVERKFYNTYSEEVTIEFLKNLKKLFSTISNDLIIEVNKNVPQYLFIKHGLFHEYEQLKKFNIIKGEVNNGKLLIKIPENGKDRLVDVTPHLKNVPLKYKIEEINIINNIYTLKGYVFLPGIDILKENLEVRNIYLMNYDKNEEKYYFNIKNIERKDLVYTEGAPRYCGFEATLNLDKIDSWQNKNFKLYFNYYYAGIEKETNITIDPFKLFELKEKLDLVTVWRLTNISKNYFDLKKDEQIKFLINNLDKKTSVINEKKESVKPQKEVVKPQKEIKKKNDKLASSWYKKLKLKKDMIKINKNSLVIDFSNFGDLNGKKIFIKDKHNAVIGKGTIKENKVKLNLDINLINIRYVKIFIEVDKTLHEINTKEVLNIDKIKRKRKLVSWVVFNKNTTPLGCYLFYKKIRG
jgi:glycosyltransferase involved in cell wall biosynthesis